MNRFDLWGGTEQHIAQESQHRQCKNQTDDIDTACKQTADLEDHERHGIGKYTLVADSEPCPLGVVHLSADRTDGGEAGGTQQIERKERITCQLAQTFKIQHTDSRWNRDLDGNCH